jgi:hypothetical protein
MIRWLSRKVVWLFLERYSILIFLFLFFSFLGEKYYVICCGDILSNILDMQKEKHILHFIVNNELLPHTIVNILYNENIHIRVYNFILFYLFNYIYFIT